MTSQYLNKRNKRYHFRIRVPNDLLAYVDRSEIRRTLKTTDRRIAQSMALTLHGNLENAFATLRHQQLMGLDPAQIRERVRRATGGEGQ